MSRNFLIIFLISLMIALTFVAGCISFPEDGRGGERFISRIETTLGTNYSEVERINESAARVDLEKNGFVIENQTGNGADYSRKFYIYTPENGTFSPRYRMGITSKSNDSIASLHIVYFTGSPESQLQIWKDYATNKTKVVATICNLTVNWTQVQWTVNYAD